MCSPDPKVLLKNLGRELGWKLKIRPAAVGVKLVRVPDGSVLSPVMTEDNMAEALDMALTIVLLKKEELGGSWNKKIGG